jgi:hypothetical protein
VSVSVVTGHGLEWLDYAGSLFHIKVVQRTL